MRPMPGYPWAHRGKESRKLPGLTAGETAPSLRQRAKEMAKPETRLARIVHYRQIEAISQRRHRLMRRQKITAIKVSQGCLDCGENHPACLQFHHLNSAEKLFSVQRALAEKKSMELIIAEIKKCVVLCANCHAKRHWIEDQQTA